MVPARGRGVRHRAWLLCAALALPLVVAGCGGSGGGGSAKHVVRVSWNASPEAAVNRTGGGYHVFYSTNPAFQPGDKDVGEADVPFRAGASQAPTSTTLDLGSGTWTIRVQAYSALTPPGGSGGSTSALSAPVQVTVP